MYSLIFQGFDGRKNGCAEAFEAAFGERGCYMSLAGDRGNHRPCELSANLTREDAGSKASILREGGVTVDIVLTENVTDVKHRASECWPTHRASNGLSFTDSDGVVTRGVSLDRKERVDRWRSAETPAPAWRFELAFNHEHPTNTLDRYGLRQARARGAELGTALTECFPERSFLIVYLDEQVSWCQFTEDLPLGILPRDSSILGGKRRSDNMDDFCCPIHPETAPYFERPYTDPEFAHAQFADCAVCGSEIILWAAPEVVMASDAANWSLPERRVIDDASEYWWVKKDAPSSFDELKAVVQDILHPSKAWCQSAILVWLGREWSEFSGDGPLLAKTLLQIEELTSLILSYRERQLSLPRDSQDQTEITPGRLGISRSSPLYHPVRRVLAPITVLTQCDGTFISYALLNGTAERFEAGRRLEVDHPVAHYECRFLYGVLNTRGHGLWYVHPSGKTYRTFNDTTIHGADAWSWRAYEAGWSFKGFREQGVENHLAIAVLFDEQERGVAQHRRFFQRFHELDIEPNPYIALDLSDGLLTIRSSVFVWGVFLGWHGAEKLPDNAFDLLPGIPYTIPWDEAVCGTPKILLTGNSLFR